METRNQSASFMKWFHFRMHRACHYLLSNNFKSDIVVELINASLSYSSINIKFKVSYNHRHPQEGQFA